MIFTYFTFLLRKGSAVRRILVKTIDGNSINMKKKSSGRRRIERVKEHVRRVVFFRPARPLPPDDHRAEGWPLNGQRRKGTHVSNNGQTGVKENVGRIADLCWMSVCTIFTPLSLNRRPTNRLKPKTGSAC